MFTTIDFLMLVVIAISVFALFGGRKKINRKVDYTE
jgi:hypothetical protein